MNYVGKTKIAAGLLQSLVNFLAQPKADWYWSCDCWNVTAASTGIVGATVVTMGISLPSMIKAGYDQKIATGTICAAGTLGQIIPPLLFLVY